MCIVASVWMGGGSELGANQSQVPAAAESDCGSGGHIADTERGSVPRRRDGKERIVDWGDFGISDDYGFGTTGVATGGFTIQSENEWTEPRTIFYFTAFEGAAGWRREDSERIARGREDSLHELVAGWAECSVREHQRRRGGRGAEFVDCGCD